MNEKTDIKLWHGHLHSDEISSAGYWPLLSAEEQDRAASFGNLSYRQRFIVVRGTLRLKLSKYLGLPPDQLAIEQSPYGKPFLADFPDVDFNLSHTADLLAIAVGRNCRLGIDMETFRPRNAISDLVERCFAEAESVWWLAQPESSRVRAFYQLWTRKEAFVKATGFGISLGLNHCIVNPENPALWLSVPDNCGKAKQWRSLEFALEENGCIALVTDAKAAVIHRATL